MRPQHTESVPVGKPSWRKPAGIFIMLGMIAVWAVIIATQAHRLGQLPILLQGVIYLILGIVWIAPLKPLMIWMETGSFRAPKRDS